MEHFIKSVRKYPCLWATTSEEYKLNKIKNAAWRNVIDECDLRNIKEAKKLWKKLRDGHRQSLNRKKTPIGQAADKDKTWKYDKMMEFLLPYMVNRQRTTNFVDVSEQIESQQSQNITAKVERDTNLENNLATEEHKINKRRHNESVIKHLEDLRKSGAQRTIERDLLRKQLLTNPEKKDAMKSFFDTMYEMSKRLPELVQMKIQREVFSSVMRAREENSS